ncbi:DMT family transporter [Photorhabdus heterorhabditis]|nr:DMT family transporter [Photorhabdus heterorhabditis]
MNTKYNSTLNMKENLKILLMAILFSVLWSSAFIAGKFGIESSPPLFLLAIRFLLAGLFMILIMGFIPSVKIPDRKPCSWLLALILGMLNNVLYLGLSFYALQILPAGFIVIIISTAPIITAVLAHFTLGELLTKKKLAGLILSICGVWLIVHGQLVEGDSTQFQLLGFALVGLSTVSMTCGTIVYRRYASDISPFWINTWSTIIAGFIMLVLSLLFENLSTVNLDRRFWIVSLYLALVVSIGAMLLWFHLIRTAGASKASACHFLNPVFGLVLAGVLLHEMPSFIGVLGVIPVCLGIGLVVRSR